MKRYSVLLSAALAFVCVSSTLAQVSTGGAAAFAASDTAQKKQTLLQIVRHKTFIGSEEMSATIRTAIVDSDPLIRELALSAIVSRAAAEHFAPDFDFVANDSALDRPYVLGLRPQIEGALKDPSEKVRLQAVTALASLDFRVAASQVELSPASELVLIRLFYVEPSARIRAKIVAGFGTDSRTSSLSAVRLLADAFRDSDYRVRHAAMSGTEKLGQQGTLLVVHNLADSNRSVRLEAAATIARMGSAGAFQHAAIEEAIKRERDPAVKYYLKLAIKAVEQ